MKPCFGPLNCHHCLRRAACQYYQLHKQDLRENATAYELLVRDPQKYQGKLF